MATFAQPADVKARWPAAPANDDQLEVLLADAALWLVSMFPQIPDAPSQRLAGVLQIVSCAMVKRSLLAADHDHLESLQQSAGVFSQSQSFRNAEGNFYITGQERAMIEGALGTAGGMATVEAEGW